MRLTCFSGLVNGLGLVSGLGLGSGLGSTLLNFRTQTVPSQYPFHTIATSPFHPDIHTLSNVGKSGFLHASGVVVATKAIDVLAYQNTNVRYEVAKALYNRERVATWYNEELTKKGGKAAEHLRVVDVGCSAGVFTKCLWDAGFRNLTALDSSPEMLAIAQRLLPQPVRLLLGNAGVEIPSADIIVCGFVMHELPAVARVAILEQAYSALSNDGVLVIVDIHKEYVPRPMMLSGEPFCLDYLEHFEQELSNSAFSVESVTWVQNHVTTHWCTKRATQHTRRLF